MHGTRPRTSHTILITLAALALLALPVVGLTRTADCALDQEATRRGPAATSDPGDLVAQRDTRRQSRQDRGHDGHGRDGHGHDEHGHPGPRHGDERHPHDGWAATDHDLARSAAPHDAAQERRLALRRAHRTVPPLRIAVIADLNSSYGSMTYTPDVHAAIAAIVEEAPDLVISVGDMVAGQRRGLDYRGMWAAFHAAVSDPLARAGIPFAVTPGNHDGAAGSAFSEERDIFVDEWTRRRPDVRFVDDRHYPLRYSFVMGPAFFISLDATTVGPLDRGQMRWLERQLEHAADYPVRIVYGHVPLYAFAEPKVREVIGDPRLEQLLLEHEVTMFISGHHHTYFPGARGPLRMLAMPCLGTGLRPLLASRRVVTPRAWVMLGVDYAGVYELDAWRSPDFSERIDRASLPDKVGTRRRPITRDDLLGFFNRKPAPTFPLEFPTTVASDHPTRGLDK